LLVRKITGYVEKFVRKTQKLSEKYLIWSARLPHLVSGGQGLTMSIPASTQLMQSKILNICIFLTIYLCIN